MKSSNQRRWMTVKSFAFGGLVGVLLYTAWSWVSRQPQVDNLPWILRSSHELSARLWSGLFRGYRAPPTRGAPAGTRPRFNGDLGLATPLDLKTWHLKVYVEDKLARTLTMSEIKLLPRTDTATQFYCIEGWSTDFSYAGVKFTDFMKAYGLSDRYRYVGLETPDHGYYVSVDMDSMVHQKTLLAYEMNERPLDVPNGAPLRLVIPVKYGIKSLKRVGTIRFSNTRPPDYWAERGYDWYSGL